MQMLLTNFILDGSKLQGFLQTFIEPNAFYDNTGNLFKTVENIVAMVKH